MEICDADNRLALTSSTDLAALPYSARRFADEQQRRLIPAMPASRKIRFNIGEDVKAKVLLVALFIATYASAARAASLPVVIEQLNTAAKACGIAEPSLESVARRTLENSQVQPDSDAGGWLNVRVTVTGTPRNACVARITVQMKAFAKPLPSSRIANPKQRLRGPLVVLCAKSGTYSPPRALFSLEVESAVEYSIKECLGSLKY